MDKKFKHFQRKSCPCLIKNIAINTIALYFIKGSFVPHPANRFGQKTLGKIFLHVFFDNAMISSNWQKPFLKLEK